MVKTPGASTKTEFLKRAQYCPAGLKKRALSEVAGNSDPGFRSIGPSPGKRRKKATAHIKTPS